MDEVWHYRAEICQRWGFKAVFSTHVWASSENKRHLIEILSISQSQHDLDRLFIGMNTQKPVLSEDLINLSAICRQLSNPNKLALIQYVQLSRFATAAVIQRKLSYSQPTVSKYLNALTQCQLLTREKIGSSILYSVNLKTWKQFNNKIALGK